MTFAEELKDRSISGYYDERRAEEEERKCKKIEKKLKEKLEIINSNGQRKCSLLYGHEILGEPAFYSWDLNRFKDKSCKKKYNGCLVVQTLGRDYDFGSPNFYFRKDETEYYADIISVIIKKLGFDKYSVKIHEVYERNVVFDLGIKVYSYHVLYAIGVEIEW